MPASPGILEYIWPSAKNTFADIRSKCRTVAHIPHGSSTVEGIPAWTVDGSSTGQHQRGSSTDISLIPVALFPHPFIANAGAVLCECFNADGSPAAGNTRHVAATLFADCKGDAPMFGFVQEYSIAAHDTAPRPRGADDARRTLPFVDARRVAQDHLAACVRAGLRVSGGEEAAPGTLRWQFKVGPCIGAEAGDHMIMARWVSQRVAEKRGVDVSYGRGADGTWRGCRVTFSTGAMRAAGGLTLVDGAVARLRAASGRDAMFYEGCGPGSDEGFRSCCPAPDARPGDVQRVVAAVGGYLEDQRPAADIDPYLATARLFACTTGCSSPRAEGVLG